MNLLRKKNEWLGELDEILLATKLHAFRSGGGLRVVVLSALQDDDDEKGYGEAPTLDVALKYAVEDFKAGGRPYDKVYGKIHPAYLTGSYPKFGGNLTLMDLLDRHVCQGNPLDAFGVQEDYAPIRVYLSSPWTQLSTPAEIIDKVKAGKTVEWEYLGKKCVSSPCRDGWVSTAPSPDSVHYIRKGAGKTFLEAALSAVEHVGEIKEMLKILSEK